MYDCNSNAVFLLAVKSFSKMKVGKKKASVDLLGRKTKTLDTRTSPTRDKMMVPRVSNGQLYTDTEFSFKVAMNGLTDADGCQWQRPSEFCTAPVLFADGTTRFDINQGNAKTCWFLAILAALAEDPKCIEQILPEDAYTPPGSAGYTGVFHCRLWHFGEWQDVYCDDCLPVKSSLPWGARSTDANELWVSLMEKAFARYHGGYSKVYGGWSGDAFVSLTGGVAERIENCKVSNTNELFDRFVKSIRSGAVITCCCLPEKNGVNGLAGGHAYTVTGSVQLKIDNETTPLLRIRNPWGQRLGEWTGAWSDGSGEWSRIDNETKRQLQFEFKDDGEFWMTLHDYLVHYSDTCICNFTPDFDKDGCEDGLSRVSCVLGEWCGESAAGADMENRMKNPRFIFTVPENCLRRGDKLPVVLQVLQQTERRTEQTNFYIRMDLYKIDHKETKNGKSCVVLDDMTNLHSYCGAQDVIYRYSLAAGEYMVVPHTTEGKQEREFCVRIFSSTELTFSQHKDTSVFFIRKEKPTFDLNGTTYSTGKTNVVIGEWKVGTTAGGQIINSTYHTNPQYTFTVQGTAKVPLMVNLLQEITSPRIPIGFEIYPLKPGLRTPLDVGVIHQIHTSILYTENYRGLYVLGWEACGKHLVPPGEYLILVFTENPNQEKNFALSVASSCDIRLTRCR